MSAKKSRPDNPHKAPDDRNADEYSSDEYPNEPRHRRRGDDTTAIDVVLGLGFIGVALWAIIYQLQRPPVNTPVILTAFAGGILGALLISPDAVGRALSRLGRVVRKIIPGGGTGNSNG